MSEMSRNALLLISVIACGFGAIALTTEGTASATAYAFNFILAALLAVLTWQDLRDRGWTWQSAVIGLSYLAAPLVGLVLYAVASRRPKQGDPVAA
jgi:hypothetical protein